MLNKLLNKFFNSSNQKEIKKYKKQSQEILEKEKYYQQFSNEIIKRHFIELKEEVLFNNKTLDDIKLNIFAIVREMAKRLLNMKHFEVQLIGGLVLHDGKIAEMKTGEGKTLVATLPTVLNAINKQVHIVTVNDYLATRDAKEFEPLYNFFDMTVGINTSNNPLDKKEIYKCNIIYGTNSEFGFDYLRDNLKTNENEFLQKKHEFVIIDEIDSILIDEAKSPLIISGESNSNEELYHKCKEFIETLESSKDFNVDLKDRKINMEESLIHKAETFFNIENLYDIENAYISHYIEQALIAKYLYIKDIQYVVKNEEIVIVDTFTGRLSQGKRYSNGLHQALEVKEHLKVNFESKTLLDITYQNYFRLYDKISGMTGTAQNEATEFSLIYNLDVVTIPTNQKIKRIDNLDLVYLTQEAKLNAIVNKIKELHSKKQPILIGTTSIEKSEYLSNILTINNLKHSVLNAKNHEQEASIIEKAGELDSITIATNMAGRGVDIKISKEVNELGGLYVIGNERYENRRIDDQLRGRSGRQGDNGETQFYLSLEDDLIKIFGGEKLKNVMKKIGLKDTDNINSNMINNSIEKAQKKIENMHFEERKHILEFDDIINEQRKIILKFRKDVLLNNFNLDEKLDEYFEFFINNLLNTYIKNENNIENNEIENIILYLKSNIGIVINLETTIKETNKNLVKIKEYLSITLKEFKERKQNTIDKEILKNYYKQFLLQVIDKYWQHHMELLDNLKTGIRLRAYNQKDPLLEFKKDSFKYFEQLLINIKIKAILIIFRLELREEEKSNIKLDEAIKILHKLNKNIKK